MPKERIENQPVSTPEESRDPSLDDISLEMMGKAEPSFDELVAQALQEEAEDEESAKRLQKEYRELRKPELQELVKKLLRAKIRDKRAVRKERLARKEVEAELKKTKQELVQERQDHERTEYQATHDSALTGLLNRRGAAIELQRHLEYLAKHAKRLESASEEERKRAQPPVMDIILIDLDFFKRFNDTYGHAVGDAVLKHAAEAVEDSLRGKGDFAVRWGGEEIMVVLPNSGPGVGIGVAERIRQNIEKLQFVIDDEKEIYEDLTASIGVAHFDGAQELAKKLTTELNTLDKEEQIRLIREGLEKAAAKADEALYVAKDQGKNRVWMYGGIQDVAKPLESPPRKGVNKIYV